MEILAQIWHLIVAAFPTTVMVFVFYLFARAVFFRPIVRVLEERESHTTGARADAARLDGETQEKLAAYHRALDQARAGIFGEQEAARRGALEQRAADLRRARTAANERVRQAKQRMETELAGAQAELERESARLAEEAVRAVLSSAEEPEPAGEPS